MSKNSKTNSSSQESTTQGRGFGQNKSKGNGRRRNFNGRGNKSNSKDSQSKGNHEYQKTPATNDVSLRIANIKQRTDAGNISWSYQTGDSIPLKCTDPSTPSADIKLPGILARAEMTTPGELFAGATPANVAANTLLSVMRSKTRVRNTYDAPDIMNVMLALVDIYAGIAWAKRLYATNLMYSYMNKYLPDALFKIQHIDPAPLRANQFAFVSQLNRIISKLNTIYVPDRMSFFQVVTIRYSNYYTEGSSIKDQLYLAYPAILKRYLFDSTTDYKGALKPTFITPYGGTTPANAVHGNIDANTDQLLYALDTMVDALINDSDVPDITGDMMNAFGESSRYLVPMLDAGSIAMPVFDEEFLEMFQNSKVSYPVHTWFMSFNASTEASTHKYRGWVIQDPTTNAIGMPNLYDEPAAKPAYTWFATDETFLTVHSDPTVDKTIMITRNADRTVVNQVGDKWRVNVYSVGFVGLAYTMAFFNTDNTIGLSEFSSEVDYDGSNAKLFLRWKLREWAFHYAPLVYVGSNTTGLTDIVGNLDIISTIDGRDLNEINRLDLLNMLGAFETV